MDWMLCFTLLCVSEIVISFRKWPPMYNVHYISLFQEHWFSEQFSNSVGTAWMAQVAWLLWMQSTTCRRLEHRKGRPIDYIWAKQLAALQKLLHWCQKLLSNVLWYKQLIFLVLGLKLRYIGNWFIWACTSFASIISNQLLVNYTIQVCASGCGRRHRWCWCYQYYAYDWQMSFEGRFF